MSSTSPIVDIFSSNEPPNIFNMMQNGFKDIRHDKMEQAFRTIKEKKRREKSKQTNESEFTVLKVLHLLDEVEDFRASDFTVGSNTVRDIKSIVTQLKEVHAKCVKSRDLRRNLSGIAPNNQSQEQLDRAHRLNLESGAQLCEQFVDRCADVTDSRANHEKDVCVK